MENLIKGIRAVLKTGSYEDQNKRLELLLKSPQNLPKADAYSLLAEVRADVEQMYNLFINTVSEKEYPEHYKAFIYYYKKIRKVSEHFS